MSRAKFCLVCDGNHTYAEICGKSIGTGVQGVRFEHIPGGEISVNLKLNIKDFEFMPDGSFNKALEKIQKEPLEIKRLE